jgi:pheromone a factor receptor
MILLYYIVQPARYMIYGIVGCISIFDATWPSIVLSYMWAPITTIVAGIYACKSHLLLPTPHHLPYHPY